MAQYTVTAGCGHTTNINLVGPITERNRRLCWMQSTDGKCNPCYAMMKRAEEHTQEEIEAKRMAEQLRAQQMDADYADKVLRLETQANEELLLKADPAKMRKARQVLRALEMVMCYRCWRELSMLSWGESTTKANQVEKDFSEQQCKHGVDIYNCYDGCYDDMKNGTVERQTAIDSKDPAGAGRRAAKANNE